MSDGHGGRRQGAGRPPGTGWSVAVTQMRTAAAERLATVAGGPRDPLEIALSIAADPNQDAQMRLSACNVILPYIYPKLSATTVSATTTNINVDANALLNRLDERIEKLRAPEPAPLIAAVQAADDGDDADADGAGDAAAADEPA